MSESRTHYDVLGVPFGAGADEVAKRYKVLLASAKASVKSAPVDPDWLARAREAYVVLSDPQKRAAYDRIVAAEREISAGAPSGARSRSNFFARAWRGEVRAWKPFWLMLLPSWAIVQLLTTLAGGLIVGMASLFVPVAVLLAIGAVLLVVLLAGAVLLWRSAFNVNWRFLGYVGRLCAVAMVVTLGFGLYDHAAGKTFLGQTARIARGEASIDKAVAKENKLLTAARLGDAALVKKLLDKGEDANVRETAQPNVGRTPLHYAAGARHYNPKGQHVEVAKLLLAHRADVNAKGDSGYTALHVASGLGQVEMVDFLLKNGADINAKDVRGTPIAAAVLQGHEPVVELLLKNKAAPREGLGSLLEISRYLPAHTAILNRLIDAGADPNAEFYNGTTAFDTLALRSEEPVYVLVSRGFNLGPRSGSSAPRAFKLAEQGYVKTLQLAIDKGFDLATRGPMGETLIHVARSPETTDFLMAKGLRVDQPDNKRNQPLHYAVRGALRPLSEHLLAKGASINAINEDGITPLMLATEREGEEAMGLLNHLLEKGADVQPRDKRGYAALDHAVAQGNDAAARRLLESGAAATARDAHGYSALHRARTRKVAEMMVAAGASAKLAAVDGKTPLHLAAKDNDQVVQFLLEQSADVNAVDKSGQTPLYSSVSRESIFKMLLEAKAAVNIVDNEGKTPLHYAAAVNSEVTRILVGKGVSLAAQDKFGNTPLHEAARLNRGYFVQELIKLGADPNIKNREGKTAIDLAEEAARAQAQKNFVNSPPSAGGPTERRALRSK